MPEWIWKNSRNKYVCTDCNTVVKFSGGLGKCKCEEGPDQEPVYRGNEKTPYRLRYVRYKLGDD